jgi:hypothetical protein
MTELQQIKKQLEENNTKLELILSVIAPKLDLLTLQEASKLLGKSKAHINRLSLKVPLIDPKAVGHRKYIRAEVEKYIKC